MYVCHCVCYCYVLHLPYKGTYSFLSLAPVITLCPSIPGNKCNLYQMKAVHSVLPILFYVTCVVVISHDFIRLVTWYVEEEENRWHVVGNSTNEIQCNGQCSYARSSTIPEQSTSKTVLKTSLNILRKLWKWTSPRFETELRIWSSLEWAVWNAHGSAALEIMNAECQKTVIEVL